MPKKGNQIAINETYFWMQRLHVAFRSLQYLFVHTQGEMERNLQKKIVAFFLTQLTTFINGLTLVYVSFRPFAVCSNNWSDNFFW